ncbi:hypothetical protein [uncultured Eubacterium sp.]|uniref:hypothetical protein n=1 Tax=uncultured Eubacterium sp. TaxID=165185 RepID=UPI0025EE1313|nr:hypothetical protein [uncultured Eubacterium sp.]MCI6537289.1 hypothetical protein [Lachnospiraceae bacterium]
MMKKIYAYSNKASKNTAISGSYLYLFLRTISVAVISLAVVLVLNLFVTIPGMTRLVFLMLVCGWITLGYGFFGGILTLMRR